MLKAVVILLLAVLQFCHSEELPTSGVKHHKMRYMKDDWRPHFGYKPSHYGSSHG